MKLKTLLSLYLVVFASTFGFATMVIVFTPMIMQPHWGIVDAAATLPFRVIILGFLLGLYPLGQFFGAPLLIHFSDRQGRKRAFITSLFMTAVAYAGISLSLYFHLLLPLFAFVLLAGLSESNLAIAECAISDFALPHHHRRLLTYIHVAWSGAFLCGAIIAAIFINDTIVLVSQLATPFAFIAVLLLVSCVWILAFFKETKEKRTPKYIRAEKAFAHFLSAFTEKKMRAFYGINFFFYLAIFGFFRAYPMHLVHHFDLSIASLAIFSIWISIPIIVTDFWFTGWAQKRFSTKSLLIFGGLLTSLSMLVIALPIAHGILLWIALFLTAFGVGCCMPLCPFYISHKAPSQLYGEVLAHDETLRTGAEAFATLTVGLLAAVFIPFPLIVFSIAALIGTLFIALKK